MLPSEKMLADPKNFCKFSSLMANSVCVLLEERHF